MKDRTSIIGTNQTTPGVATAPTNLTSVDDVPHTTALTIKFLGDDFEQQAVQVVDSSGNPIWEITQTAMQAIDTGLGVAPGVFNGRARLSAFNAVPCLEFPDGNGSTQGQQWFSGTGHPSSTTVDGCRFGDLYFRRDGTAARTDGSCTTTNGSPTVADTSAVATDVGKTVSGTGIPAGAYIISVNAGTSFTMSDNATASGTVSLTLGGNSLNTCIIAGSPGTWRGIG